MRIGQLQQRTGVSKRLLRYYEEQGLIHPSRTSGGYRDYDESDVAKVMHVRNLLAAGLSTSTIADLLPCLGSHGYQLIADCPEILVDLYRERERATAAIRDLEAARDTLDSVIATAPEETRREAAALLERG